MTDQVLSRFAWGAWRLQKAGLSAQALNRLVHGCVEIGITSFDHADVYGNFGCEAQFGAALALSPGLRDRVQLLTKCGIRPVSTARPEHRAKHYDSSDGHIERSIAASLQALRTDRLDVLMLHRPDYLMDADETARALTRAIAQGQVRSVGVSNFSVSQLALLAARLDKPPTVQQVEISLLHRAAFDNGVLDQCQQLGVRPMAWSPLAGGALWDGGEAGARVAPVLQRVAQEQGVGEDAVALAWLLRHPAGIVPVLGSMKLERLRCAVAAEKVQLDRQDWYELWAAASGVKLP